MKNLLKKLWPVDCSGKGVFFTLTLWVIGLYFLISVFIFLAMIDVLKNSQEDCLQSLLLIAMISTLGAAFKLGWFYYRESKPRCWLRWLFWPAAIFSVTIPIGVSIQNLDHLFFAVPGFFIFWFLMLLLLPKVKWYYALGNALAWAGGILIVLTIFLNARSPYKCISKFPGGDGNFDEYDRSFGPHDYIGINSFWSIPKFFDFSAADWFYFLLLGVAFLAAGYWLLAKIFAGIDGLPWRRMFGKGVLALWSLAAATYLFFVMTALWQNHQSAQNIKLLTQYFCRPLTMAALGEQYYNGDQPDMKFWSVLDNQRFESNNISDKINFYGEPLSDMPPEELVEARQKFARLEPILTRWEQAFTTQNPAPPLKRKYLPGKEMELIFYDVPIIKSFHDWELWRLRFALADKETALALQIYQRIKTVDDILLRENNLCGISNWLYCENQRLDALQWLLESGRLTDLQLQAIKTDLQTTESQIPVIKERWYYGDTVARLDVYDRIGYGFRELPNLPLSPPLYYLQWALPQVWWVQEKEKNQDTRLMIREYVKNDNIASWPRSNFNTQLKCLTARLRAAKTILRAIEYKQQHDHYPETLDNLPLDPFTGQPMQYHAGERQIVQTYLITANDPWNDRRRMVTAPVVICWSVGPNLKDDQGKGWSPYIPYHEPDDAAFIVRIKP